MYKNKNIVINCRFLNQKITGVQRFGIEITKELVKLSNNIICVSPRNILYDDLAKALKVQRIGFNTGHLWEQLDLPLFLIKSNAVLINLANTGPVFYFNKIITLHDILFIRYPNTFSWSFRLFYKNLIPLLLKTSKDIFTVSEFSKSEISSYYNIRKDRITIIYNSVNSQFYPTPKSNCEKYILAVSSVAPHKNFHNLIKAFSIIKNKNVKLYIVGHQNNNFKQIDIDHTTFKRINFLGRVNDQQLNDLYSNAICFVHPSFYEGFGIPPIEAQSCGTAVISSNAASLPEIGLDSFLYVDPKNINDIAKKIQILIQDKHLQRKLINKGYENVKRFSWKKSAEKIINSI